MLIFKMFCLSEDGRVMVAEDIVAVSSSAVRELGERRLRDYPVVEIWEASVLVARLRRARPAEPG